MTCRSAQFVFTTLAVLVLAAAGLVSASEMPPDQGDQAELVMAAAFGPDYVDLCGDVGGHDHHCPFCHKLPDPPLVKPVAIAAMLRPHDGWSHLEDLNRAAQARELHHAPRAPPARD